MPLKLYRFGDLKAMGVVASWAQLARMIATCGFPPGKMLSPAVRTWTDEEITAYYKARPVAGPEPRGIAALKKQRKAERLAAAAPAAEVAVRKRGRSV
jgi:hypothetical protein